MLSEYQAWEDKDSRIGSKEREVQYQKDRPRKVLIANSREKYSNSSQA